MTETQLQEAIYSAFYRVVRVGVPLSRDSFFSSKIKETWPTTPAPADWPTFWYEAVALEIQHGFIDSGKYLNKFDGDWLKKNQAKKWQDVYDWAAEDLMDYEQATQK